MLRHLRALLRDERGAVELIQLALLVPVFITILYGSFELVKVLSIRQSLDAGTYQAARYLSVYHESYVDSSFNRPLAEDQLRAERLIWDSLLANPFITLDDAPTILIRYFDRDGVQMVSPVDFPCAQISNNRRLLEDPRMVFTVHAEATVPWRASVLGVTIGTITLTSAHTAFVDCGPWYPWPGPTATPTATPAP